MLDASSGTPGVDHFSRMSAPGTCSSSPPCSSPARSRWNGYSTPQLGGTWAWEGTGPSGLVAHGPRLATLTLHQHGHALTGVERTGNHSYALLGTYYYPKPDITLRYSLKHLAAVRFSGALQHGGTRILGQWTDARGNDGGAILVKVVR